MRRARRLFALAIVVAAVSGACGARSSLVDGPGARGGASSSASSSPSGSSASGASTSSSSASGSTATSSSTSGVGGGGPCAPGATKPCYDGPLGTEGLGPCHGGTATCAPDGSGFGPCEGEVLPMPEICSTPIDEDCNGDPGCVAVIAWSKVLDGFTIDSLATDSAGDIVMRGSGWSPAFGAPPPDPSFSIAAALDPSGDVAWASAVQVPGPPTSVALYGRAVATLGTDAWVSSAVGGGSLTRFDAKGSVTAQILAKGAIDQNPVVTTSPGLVAIAGAFGAATSVDWGAGALVGNAGDSYLALFDAAQVVVVWMRALPGVRVDDARLDDAGNLYAAVHVKPGGQLDPSVAETGPMLARWNVDGTLAWHRTLATLDLFRLAVEGGALTLTSTMNGTEDFGTGAIASTPDRALLVLQTDLAGATRWVNLFPATPTSYADLATRAASPSIALYSSAPVSFGASIYAAAPWIVGLGWLDANGAHQKSLGYAAEITKSPATPADLDPTGAFVVGIASERTSASPGTNGVGSVVLKYKP